MKQSDKQFDAHIRSMFEEHEVPYDPGHWELFEQDLEISGLEEDFISDEMIDSIKHYEAEPIPGDWEVFSTMLDQDEAAHKKQFDQEVRQSVDGYEAPYDERTWPILERKLTAAEARRRKLVITKVLEIASILIFLFTFYNFYPEIHDQLFRKDKADKQAAEAAFFAEKAVPADGDLITDLSDTRPADESFLSAEPEAVPETSIQQVSMNATVRDSRNARGPAQKIAVEPSGNRQLKLVHNMPGMQDLFRHVQPTLPGIVSSEPADTKRSISIGHNAANGQAYTAANEQTGAGSIPPLDQKLHVQLFRNPAYRNLYTSIQPNTRKKARKRLGINANAGINVLHFPADNFYSGGEQITFDAQDLPALGYGGGFSIGWFGKRFGFETGIQYSNKSFKPGRQLLIGESLENSKVDFQAVQIDLISIPMMLTYHIKPFGNFRVYTLAGLGFNLIAQAHYDLKIENNYPLPLSITQSASALASNREAHRVREHILDGATFKSKSHITAFVGFGLENYLTPDLSLFVQPAYAHQVPSLRFTNNNGKHFKNLNIRIGARTTLQ